MHNIASVRGRYRNQEFPRGWPLRSSLGPSRNALHKLAVAIFLGAFSKRPTSSHSSSISNIRNTAKRAPLSRGAKKRFPESSQVLLSIGRAITQVIRSARRDPTRGIIPLDPTSSATPRERAAFRWYMYRCSCICVFVQSYSCTLVMNVQLLGF